MKVRSLRRDRRGAVTVVFAASAVSLLCLAGVVLDGGFVYSAKRSLQGATDLAAISAASNIPDANAAANATAESNAYLASEVTLVTPGIYSANPAIPVSLRFVPTSVASANAVQVTMTRLQPLVFADIFRLQAGSSGAAGVPGHATIVTQAIASSTRTVSYAIGSTVASFNGGIVNQILGAAVGGQVSLSAIDYQSLASTQVDLFALAKAISVEIGQVGDGYGEVTGQTISMVQFIAALQSVAPSAAPALEPLESAASLSETSVDLSRLITFGPYASQSTTEPEPQLTATASVLALIQGAAQVNGTPHLISITSFGPNIPGISSVSGMMTLGEPAQGTTVFAVNTGGTSLHTAQVRLYLDVVLASLVDGGVLHLPLYLEVGYGDASLGALSCNALDSSQTQVTLDVTPGLLNGWIGTVTAADMTNYTKEPVPTAATLLNLANIATVTDLTNVQIGNLTATPVVFSAADIQNVAVHTTSTQDFIGSLIASLVGRAQLQVNVLGLGLAVPPGLTSSVSEALVPAVAPVDQLITDVLQTTGAGVGQAATWVSGARCAAALLAG